MTMAVRTRPLPQPVKNKRAAPFVIGDVLLVGQITKGIAERKVCVCQRYSPTASRCHKSGSAGFFCVPETKSKKRR